MITRRNFLQKSLGTSIGMGLSPLFSMGQALAQSTVTNKNHSFVVFVADGGLDVVLGLDPKVLDQEYNERDLFLGYRPEERLQVGNLFLGPTAGDLARSSFVSDMVIINGIYHNSENVDHRANLAYITSGNSEGKSPFILSNPGFSPGKKDWGVLYSGSAAPITNSNPSNRRLISTQDINSATTISPTLARNLNLSALKVTNQEILNYQKETQNVRAYSDTLKQQNLDISEAQSQFLASLHLNLARFATFSISEPDIDSHTNHYDTHSQAQSQVWNQVTRFVEAAKKIPTQDGQASLYDNMTVIVVSDFSRTIGLNLAKGKDHNPETNSMLIISPLLKLKQQVIGESLLRSANVSRTGFAQHIGLPIDYKTGQVYQGPMQQIDSNVAPLYPENVYASLAVAFGFNPKNLFPSLSNVRVLPQFKRQSLSPFDF